MATENEKGEKRNPYSLYARRVSESGRVTYEPVAEWWDSGTLPHGAWLVVSRQGIVSTRPVKEDVVDIVGAAEGAREAMISAILKRRETSHSVADVVDAGIAVLVEAAKVKVKENAGG